MSASVSGGEGSERRGTVLAVAGLMLALFLVALDQTVVGTALPQIIADLNGFEHYAWVTTAYLLASTAMIPVIGKLGDIYGRKWFIIAGVALFLAASALCGAAWGMTELILFRGLQGLGAGMIFANISTSVADIFPDPALGATLAGALETDARSDEDRDLARFLHSTDLSLSANPNPEEATALRSIADRIEGATETTRLSCAPQPGWSTVTRAASMGGRSTLPEPSSGRWPTGTDGTFRRLLRRSLPPGGYREVKRRAGRLISDFVTGDHRILDEPPAVMFKEPHGSATI